jgi:hypothetical protein
MLSQVYAAVRHRFPAAHPSLIESAVHSAFQRFWRNLVSEDMSLDWLQGDVVGFLVVTAYYRALDRLKKQGRITLAPSFDQFEGLLEANLSAEDRLVLQELAQELKDTGGEILHTLNTPLKRILFGDLVLKHSGRSEDTYNDIATRRGCTERYVREVWEEIRQSWQDRLQVWQ